MLSDSAAKKKIKPNFLSGSVIEGHAAAKVLAFLVFYLYFLIVLVVYDFTVVGLISAILIPAGLVFLTLLLINVFKATISQYAAFVYVITLFFLFLKKIIPIVSSIRTLFLYSSVFFDLKILSAIFLVAGVVFLFRKSLVSTVIGISLSGLAMTLCLFHSRTGFFISHEGLKFISVYAVFHTAYCIILKFSDNAYCETVSKEDKDSIRVDKYKLITNFVMLLLSVVFAFVYRVNTELLNWDHVMRFIDISFSLAIVIPLLVVFSIYYIRVGFMTNINLVDKTTSKRIRTDKSQIEFYVMLYILCGVLYRHYFTFNFLLLLAFVVLHVKKKNTTLAFFNLVLLDILVSMGRTETAIIIGLFEWLIIRMYDRNKLALTKFNKDHKPIYNPSGSEVIESVLRKKSSWVLAIVAITSVMASFLLHVKSAGATRASFIGFIGFPDWKSLVIMVACALLCVFANNMLLYKSKTYKHNYAYSAVVLLFLFVACLVVVKKDYTYFRIDASESSMLVSYNAGDSEIESIAMYRGSNIPFMSSKFSDYVGLSVPDGDSFVVYYPRAGSAFCERFEYLIEDENNCYTTYDVYYPFSLYSFFENK